MIVRHGAPPSRPRPGPGAAGGAGRPAGAAETGDGLRHLEGLSNPDVAQIMQISVEAVESLMSRGKRSLAHALAPQKKALGLEDDG